MIKRRAFAAIVLYGFAIGSALYWNNGALDWTYMAPNLIGASAGLIYLHLRWRRKEARAMTPQKVKDIFS